MKPTPTTPLVQNVSATTRAMPLWLVLAVGFCLSACKQETKVVATNDAAGTYRLATVNGKPLPAALSHEGVDLQVRSGTFTISADGTCSSKTVFVPPSGTETTREVSATYARAGSRLDMQWKGAGKTTGTIANTTFTMDNEGMVFVYTK